MKRISPRRSRRTRTGLTLLVGIMTGISLSGCAQTGMPEGGPPDTTSPTVVRTWPNAGAVDVPLNASIEIEFSEPVNKEKFPANLYISPRRTGQLTYKWSGSTVRLTWPDSLRDDITYRVTVGAKLTDRHGNPFADAHTFAFATGTQIDSGRVVGQVWNGTSAAGAMDVIAYPLLEDEQWQPSDPGFQTQTGADGRFDLPYLPTSRFRVLALSDKNGNGQPDNGESIGIPARDAEGVSSGTPAPLRLFLHVFDTSSFTLAGCSMAPDGSILIGLTHPIDTTLWQAPPLQLRDSASGSPLPLAVLRPLPPSFTVIPAIGSGLVAGRAYEISLDPSIANGAMNLRDANGRSLSHGSCSFTCVETLDTTGPRVQWTWFPEYGRALRPGAPIEFGFNELVDTTRLASALRVYDSSGAAIAGHVALDDPRRIGFTPALPWPETEVIVTLDSAALVDRQGNPAPSQTFSWSFVPLTEEQIGQVGCRVEIPESEDTSRIAPVVIWSIAARGGQRMQWATAAEEGVELSLPSGDWIFGAYLDADGDRRYFPGSIDPFLHAERQTILTDTVTVRARFTVEDIVIRF